MSCSIATNSSSIASPVITSGMTSGAVVMAARMVRPRKRPKRASTSPASVPSTTARQPLMVAIFIDSQAAPMICESWNSCPYHFRVGELAWSHTVTSFE